MSADQKRHHLHRDLSRKGPGITTQITTGSRSGLARWSFWAASSQNDRRPGSSIAPSTVEHGKYGLRWQPKLNMAGCAVGGPPADLVDLGRHGSSKRPAMTDHQRSGHDSGHFSVIYAEKCPLSSGAAITAPIGQVPRRQDHEVCAGAGVWPARETAWLVLPSWRWDWRDRSRIPGRDRDPGSRRPARLRIFRPKGHNRTYGFTRNGLPDGRRAYRSGRRGLGGGLQSRRLSPGHRRQQRRTCLWNVATGRRIATLTDPQTRNQGVLVIAFSPRTGMLATGDGKSRALLWKAGR